MKYRIMTPRDLLCLLATYLGIFSIALCQSTCPTRCLCYLSQLPRTITCSKQGLEVFPENISDVVQELNLSNNLLTNVTDDINRLIDLRILKLARNKLTSLPEDLSSLNSLQTLDLTANNIKHIVDVRSIVQLSSLTVLYLSRNPLSKLEGLMSASIRALDASHCEIRELTNTSLDDLPELTMLTLMGNPLKDINKTWSPKLEWLDMSDCLLNYLRPDTFNGFPALEELRLSNNPTLVYSTRNSTLTHSKLKTLDVSKCNLDRPGLHGLPSLTQARLSRNMIHMLPDRIFAKNRKLGFLYLNANGIEKLNMSTFEGLVKLQVLDLSANYLEVIHPLTFHENVELKVLNLSYNVLYELPSLMSTVTTLDASSNLISDLDENFLANMPKIRSVILNNNQLQKFPSKLKSTSLKNLDLRRNRLVEVCNDTFLELPQLLRIDLSGNRLTEAINPEIFRNNPDLNTIKLEDNPWRCDCIDLYLTYSFLTEPPAKTVDQSLLCQSPSNVSGYTWHTACFNIWNKSLYYNKDRTWGFVMIVLLTIVVLSGSFISIRHMMRIKRRAIEQRQQLETLRLLSQRRNQIAQQQQQQQQQEHIEHVPEPRIHPLELIGPPSYEEAIQMPRLARSLDNLDEISETTSVRVMGSADNIRYKYRRTRRTKKKIQSEDDLLRREERRHERLRRERNNSAGNSEIVLPQSQRNSKANTARRARRNSAISDSIETGSERVRAKPQTPSSRKRRQRYTVYDGHSTDDEDSDVGPVGSSRSIVIRELRREPKSGYREPVVEQDS
ncbi:hypothetical protein QLX08_000165 [Tetragonisca angustula]